jgi:glycosyltransferase involved in cell wall biosynthesis
MRIAQVAPLHESVPPHRYGGTERVVHYITEELVQRGHEVTLFASGDSRTSAELHACVPRALRLCASSADAPIHETLQLEAVCSESQRFDVIHFHTGPQHFPLSSRMGVPHLTTQHGRLDLTALSDLFRVFRMVPLVSISDHQRLPVPGANWQATIYHGLPPDCYQPVPRADDYFAFVGRISPEKRLDRAIAIATALGLPLRVAAKVDPVDRDYFETQIRPLIDGNPLVEFVGEVDDADKQELIGRAQALLFPIDWPEPFGLVMIEAMACGTPVIAWRNGSVPEVVRDGVSGFIVDSLPAAIAAARCVTSLDRTVIRSHFERHFSVGRMVDDYERLYRHAALDRRATGRTQRNLVHAW